MGLTNITGLLSRYFAVGFFLPAYFALLLLWVCSSRGFIPDDFERYTGGTQLAVLGGIALLVALALSGLNYAITRFFEGYPLELTEGVPGIGLLYTWFVAGQRRRYDRLVAVRDSTEASQRERTRAARKLDRYYPQRRERLLPTAFGNAIRAFEAHSHKRYGLDAIGAFPRIEMMMTAEEREPVVEAKIDVNVFLNAAIGALAIGIALIIDAILNTPLGLVDSWVLVLPFVAAWVLYWPTVGAAVRWGTEVRSAVDLHRLDLYRKLGVRRPTSFSDERVLAEKVNYLLIFGINMEDSFWRPQEDETDEG